MAINMRNAFAFIKLEEKLTKEEIFLLSYILGCRDSALQIMQNQYNLDDKAIDEVDEQVFDFNTLNEAWNKCAAEMQITNERSYEEVMEIVYESTKD